MDYFLLHYEYEEYFESLPSDEDRAKLLMALFAYAKGEKLSKQLEWRMPFL